LVINLSMFKIHLENGEFYKSKSGRVQHYKSNEKADAKIKKLGNNASSATVIECKARTTTSKTEKLEENATDTEVVKSGKSKKLAAKSEKPDESATDATDAKVAKGKVKKNQRND
jgi:hypothetical protein